MSQCPRFEQKNAPAGRSDLSSPKLEKGSSFPTFLEPRPAAGKASAAAIQEVDVLGVSTRPVDDLVKAVGADVHEAIGLLQRFESQISYQETLPMTLGITRLPLSRRGSGAVSDRLLVRLPVLAA